MYFFAFNLHEVKSGLSSLINEHAVYVISRKGRLFSAQGLYLVNSIPSEVKRIS
jgi:hypothetical protein